MLYQALQKTQTRSATTVSSGGGLFSSLFGLGSSASNVNVTNNTALTLSAFYNGVNIIANDIAKLPKGVYKKDGPNSIKLSEHSLQYVMAKRPNQYMTSFSFHHVLTVDAILKGNGFAEIIRDNYTGNITAMQLIDQNKTPVTIKKFENKLWYHFDKRVVAAENIFHIPGFSFNGISGMSVIQMAAKSLGVALESQEFAIEYYKNKGIGLGVVTTSKPIPDNDAKLRLANSISSALTAKSSKKFGVAVLDEMGSFQHVKITPQEALFLETNQKAIGEVARFLNIPVYKLKDTQNQNNSNMEHQSISHVSDSILPWKKKYEEEYDYKCFTSTEKQQNHFVKFNTKVLLVSDQKSQAEYYRTMFNIMAMTPAEIRDKEDANFIEGLDQPFLPVNIQSLEQLQLAIELKKKELKSNQ